MVSVGQHLSLMCIGQDVRGNIKLSLKSTLPQPKLKAIKVEQSASTPKGSTSTVEETSGDAEKCSESTSSIPSIVIRSVAECDEVEKSSGAVKTSESSPKSVHIFINYCTPSTTLYRICKLIYFPTCIFTLLSNL